MSINMDQEILMEFIEESNEHLDGIESDLLLIEETAKDLDLSLVNKVFRSIHSIKGAAGFLGLETIKNLTHHMENLLNLIRNSKLEPTSAVVNVLLTSSDVLQNLINDHENSNSFDITTYVDQMTKVVEDPSGDAEAVEEEAAETTAQENAPPEPEKAAAKPKTTARSTKKKTQPSKPRAQKAKSSKPAAQQPAATSSKPAPKKSKAPAKDKRSSTTLRVNVTLLDNLMTLAGELVLTRNQLIQAHSSNDGADLGNAIQRVDLVTSELQEAIMSTRMQPIGNVFGKFQRVVRDLSRSLGKDINLVIEGKDVELDKTIVEAIGDPLTHLVRNSCDHGIELPDVRRAAGKKVPATLTLRAFHEAGQVLIEIEDDGAGIDVKKVKAKALDTGNFDPAELDAMPESELVKLIFRPGFSLAKKVTEVSGRGVGMDVVHSNLTKLGGSIDIDTKVGVGTTIRIKLPLTLAIIPSLILMVQEERYAIPQVNLVELVRIPASEVKNKIVQIDDALVMRLRGELLPLIQLTSALSINKTYRNPKDSSVVLPDRRTNIADRRGAKWSSGQPVDPEAPDNDGRQNNSDRRTSPDSAYNVVVVNAGELNYGLIVDSFLDSQEIVVKPLSKHFSGLNTYAGATILGDGLAALILDVMGIRNTMNLRMIKEKAREVELAHSLKHAQDAQSLLIVRNSPDSQFAIPLGLVSRIEKIDKNDIEITGGRQAIKYRDTNLLLFSIEDTADVGKREEVDNPYIIIFNFKKREVGIMVSHIIDVIDSKVDIDNQSFRQPGIMGSAIIFEQITLLVDLYEIIADLVPDWLDEDTEAVRQEKEETTILLVDDSPFFMNQVKKFTESEGYNVLTAEDGLEALETLQTSEVEIDLVLTDIEMPNLDGYGMAERLRNELRLDKLPVIAITTLAGTSAEQKAMEVGIDEFLVKLDREKLLERIQHYLKNGRAINN